MFVYVFFLRSPPHHTLYSSLTCCFHPSQTQNPMNGESAQRNQARMHPEMFDSGMADGASGAWSKGVMNPMICSSHLAP